MSVSPWGKTRAQDAGNTYGHVGISVSPWGKTRAQDMFTPNNGWVVSVSPWGKTRAQDAATTEALGLVSVSPWGKTRAQDCWSWSFNQRSQCITLGKDARSRQVHHMDLCPVLVYHLGERRALKTLGQRAPLATVTVTPWITSQATKNDNSDGLKQLHQPHRTVHLNKQVMSRRPFVPSTGTTGRPLTTEQ